MINLLQASMFAKLIRVNVQCHMMDNVGLDTVSNIEEHYVKERGIKREHLDWLNEHYVKEGKLGKKTASKGGLYGVPPKGSQTKLIFLNLGTAEPISDKLSFDDIQVSGTNSRQRHSMLIVLP